MPLPRIYFHLFLAATMATIAQSLSTGQFLKDCPSTCGNVSIPYPFGMKQGCYHDKRFLIICDTTSNPPTAVLGATGSGGNITVVKNISLDGQFTIMKHIAHECYDRLGNHTQTDNPGYSLANFKISYTRNKFMVIGCDTYASIRGTYHGNRNYRVGCMSICDSIDYVDNSSCSGIGCCQTSIPRGVDNFAFHLGSKKNHTDVWDFCPCSYAFLVENNMYNFSQSSFRSLKNVDKLPMVMDWAIGNETCLLAKESKSYVCGEYSYCYDATNGPGYLCSCLEGYQGNPFLSDGCQDINECEDPTLNQCEKVCTNKPGNYTCSCPTGHHGDGIKGRRGCVADESITLKIVLGTVIFVTIFLVAFFWGFLLFKKRKLLQMKEMFFKQNGGMILKQQLSNLGEGSSRAARIFSEEELEKATDSYANSKIIGKGGYGTVYKGQLSDGRTVAIKKSKNIDESQMEQFVNEIVLLSQINHRNVVQLLGCCLETRVPLLVYEFIPNGTLYEHLHNTSNVTILTWSLRVNIAAETAGVLSYLHSAASVPIIHRDVKSTNILLDEKYGAKVSDFGTSRLIPLDEVQLTTMVQGTLGYLDPEYLYTNQLTEKSDVYSFGVVLVELLTRRKVLCFDKHNNEINNLAMDFVESLEGDRCYQILDECIAREACADHLKEIANLAKRCLSLKGNDRPTMKEVAMELEGLRVEMAQNPCGSCDSDENEHLLGAQVKDFGVERDGF